MSAIYKKEMRAYAHNMIAYIFVAFMLLVAGIFMTYYNFLYASAAFEHVPANTTFVYLIAIPILAMNVLAGEQRNKTDQLLLTSSASITDIVLGKYFAMLTVLAVPIGIMATYPLILSAYGPVYLPTAYLSLLGFFLLGATMMAIATFISSLTESPVISAVVSVVVFMVVYLIDGVDALAKSGSAASVIAVVVIIALIVLLLRAMTKNTTLSVMVGIVLMGIGIILYFAAPQVLDAVFVGVLKAVGLFGHMNNLTNGILDLTSIFYFLSVTVLALFFCVQSIEKRRWS